MVFDDYGIMKNIVGPATNKYKDKLSHSSSYKSINDQNNLVSKQYFVFICTLYCGINCRIQMYSHESDTIEFALTISIRDSHKEYEIVMNPNLLNKPSYIDIIIESPIHKMNSIVWPDCLNE